MHQCAFLTLDDPTGFVMDDDLAVEPFLARGWRVVAVPWRQTARRWSSFDAVVIRSTWDYPRDVGGFLAVLEGIAGAGIPLFNPWELVRWNASKAYLDDLAARGVPVVPTRVRPGLGPGEADTLFDEVDGDEVVVKPVVGANASGVFRLKKGGEPAQARRLEAEYAGRPLMVQPMVQAVVDEGEHSLVYLDGELSHALLKTPAVADFRVQEEHGATIRAARPDDALRRAGDAVLAALPDMPLYARVDLVRANGGGGFWLMELELVEPSLYLRLDPAAATRFADAFCRRVSTS